MRVRIAGDMTIGISDANEPLVFRTMAVAVEVAQAGNVGVGRMCAVVPAPAFRQVADAADVTLDIGRT